MNILAVILSKIKFYLLHIYTAKVNLLILSIKGLRSFSYTANLFLLLKCLNLDFSSQYINFNFT